MTLKPETLERRRRERAARQHQRREDLARRLRAKAAQEGLDSIWAEMLEELKGSTFRL